MNAETAFLLYPFKQGQIEERIELIADKDDCTVAGFDVLINSGDNLIVQTKELIPGINGFDKYPVARMDHYKITANNAVQLNDYSAQPIYLLEEDMEEYGGITQVGDTYYFISANFFPSEKKKNKLLKGRKLSSFQL